MVTRSSRLHSPVLFLSLYFVILTATLFFLFQSWAYDDPFITYRYSYNLAIGMGFVYNMGERVLSTTTPLFAMLLAVLEPIWPNLPKVANLIGIGSLAVGALCLWDLSKSWKTPWVGWVSLALYPTFPLLLSTIGSETPLYLAICLGAFVAYARDKQKITGLLIGLAILCRPDAAIVPGILWVDYLWRRKRIPWSGVGILAGILILWSIFSWFYFGSIIPATLLAKQHQGMMGVSEKFAPGFLSMVHGYAKNRLYYLETIFCAIGIIWGIIRKQRWMLLLGWTILYFTSYSILGVTRYFWYYAPLVPGFIVAIGLGISALSEMVNKLFTFGKTYSLNVKPKDIILIGFVVIFLLQQSWSIWQTIKSPDQRYAVYHDVGTWLEANTQKNDRVGALEVGIIGYYAHRSMIDFAGLIQPQTALIMTKTSSYDDVAFWAANQFHPEYIVFAPGTSPRLENDYVNAFCQTEVVFSKDKYHYSTDINIARCIR
jgi:hypothetical protein